MPTMDLMGRQDSPQVRTMHRSSSITPVSESKLPLTSQLARQYELQQQSQRQASSHLVAPTTFSNQQQLKTLQRYSQYTNNNSTTTDKCDNNQFTTTPTSTTTLIPSRRNSSGPILNKLYYNSVTHSSALCSPSINQMEKTKSTPTSQKQQHQQTYGVASGDYTMLHKNRAVTMSNNKNNQQQPHSSLMPITNATYNLSSPLAPPPSRLPAASFNNTRMDRSKSSMSDQKQRQNNSSSSSNNFNKRNDFMRAKEFSLNNSSNSNNISNTIPTAANTTSTTTIATTNPSVIAQSTTSNNSSYHHHNSNNSNNNGLSNQSSDNLFSNNITTNSITGGSNNNNNNQHTGKVLFKNHNNNRTNNDDIPSTTTTTAASQSMLLHSNNATNNYHLNGMISIDYHTTSLINTASYSSFSSPGASSSSDESSSYCSSSFIAGSRYNINHFNNNQLSSIEPRPFRPFKSNVEYLYAMREDLAEWLNRLYGDLDINVDNFMPKLETGVVLCRHANAVTTMGRSSSVMSKSNSFLSNELIPKQKSNHKTKSNLENSCNNSEDGSRSDLTSDCYNNQFSSLLFTNVAKRGLLTGSHHSVSSDLGSSNSSSPHSSMSPVPSVHHQLNSETAVVKNQSTSKNVDSCDINRFNTVNFATPKVTKSSTIIGGLSTKTDTPARKSSLPTLIKTPSMSTNLSSNQQRLSTKLLFQSNTNAANNPANRSNQTFTKLSCDSIQPKRDATLNETEEPSRTVASEAVRQETYTKQTKCIYNGFEIDWNKIKDVSYRLNANSGTFHARDNVCNFINWCRSIHVLDCLLFETDDLVMRKNERSFVLCLLEVARLGFKVGMPTPLLVQMEQEIDRQIEQETKGIQHNENLEIDKEEKKHQIEEKEEEGIQQAQVITNDLVSLHERVVELLNMCSCPTQFPMVRIADGKYRVGDKLIIFLRILRNHIMVRVGGGWDTLEHYLDKHDPCRCKAIKCAFGNSVFSQLAHKTN